MVQKWAYPQDSSQIGCQFPRSAPVFTIGPIVNPGDGATPINAYTRDTKSDKGYTIHSFKTNCSDTREA